MRFVLEALQQQPIARRRCEFVEAKGVGHPDTICDALVESISVALARMYLERLGFVAHFNVDKALLAAGQCAKTFLGGQVVQPMRLFFGDRATFVADGQSLPVIDAAEQAVAEWLQTNLPRVRLGRELAIEPVLAPGSAPLRRIYGQPEEVLSNDTSGAVGFAPFTPTEELTRAVCTFLNSESFKHEFPDTGQDVKVFAVRSDQRIELTIAMPFLCEAIDTEATYFRRKEEVLHALQREFSGGGCELDFRLNTLDQRGQGADGLYLTLTGTSAEDADSGQVGRGNRPYGFIAFARPVGGEAAPGKNPVGHVGKIYSVASQRIAEQIHAHYPELLEVYVSLAVRIGEPVAQPWVSVQLLLPPGSSVEEFAPSIQELVSREVEALPELWRALLAGKFRVY
ncbi:MAG: S-adenosylmethionine synthetase [Candidatus Binatia bacterium]|nr:MAG: S-adenosylmethionine synthetase [Candidatus Binatia bacterium]